MYNELQFIQSLFHKHRAWALPGFERFIVTLGGQITG